MTVDPFQPHRPVGHRGVEVGGGGHAPVAPQFLVPAAAADPAQLRVGGRIVAQPLLQFGDRARVGDVELECGFAQSHDVAVCVDQAPEVFRVDENDNLHILIESPPEALRKKVEAAVRLCPRQAISIVE